MSEDPAIPLFVVASLMVLVGFTAVSAEVALSGLLRAERLGTRLGPALLDELGEALPLTAAVVVAGPFTALMQPVLGLATLPFTLFPVGLTYVAVRRYAANRTTYREIISTLSRMTERGRYTPVDHAQRVAALSVRIGRRLGMAERSIPNLEFAALLHDLGQIALREPIPGGATTSAAPADQAQIAADGAAIVRSTEVLEQVARYIELQAVPYRLVREDDVPVPIESRIIKVANAFDDLTGGHVTPESKASALERLSLGLGYEYDPDVVEALAEVVESGSSPREPKFRQVTCLPDLESTCHGRRGVQRAVDRLEPVVFEDAWGSHVSIASLQGRTIPTVQPESELWMGAHEEGPSGVDRGGYADLASLIAANPERELGPQALAAYGPRLPFLLKVLAPNHAISIQVHPSAERAVEVRRATGSQVYVDDWAKPELLVAVSAFEVFVGMRSIEQVAGTFRGLGVRALVELLDRALQAPDPLHALLAGILHTPDTDRVALVRDVVAACVMAEGRDDPDGEPERRRGADR